MVDKITSPISNNDMVNKVNNLIDLLPIPVKSQFTAYETAPSEDPSGAYICSTVLSNVTLDTNYRYKPIVVFTSNNDVIYRNSSKISINNSGVVTLTFYHRHQYGNNKAFYGYITFIPLEKSKTSTSHSYGLDNGGYMGEGFNTDIKFTSGCLNQLEIYSKDVASVATLETNEFDTEHCYSHTFALPLTEYNGTYTVDVYLPTDSSVLNGVLYRKVYNRNPYNIKLYFYNNQYSSAPNSINARIVVRKYDRSTTIGDVDYINIHYYSPAYDSSISYAMSYALLSTDITVTANSTIGLYNWQFNMPSDFCCSYTILLPEALRGHVKSTGSMTRSMSSDQNFYKNSMTIVTDLASVPSYVNWCTFVAQKIKGTAPNLQTNGYLDLLDASPTQNSSKLLSSGAVYTVLGDIETLINAL